MEQIKKLFPLAFAPKSDVNGLIRNIVIHLLGWIVLYVVGVVFGWLELALINTIFGLFADIVKLYLGASIIVSVLDYLKVFKD